MSITIEQPETKEELTEFLLFADEVSACRSAHWRVIVPMQLPLLMGEGPSAEGRTVLPLVARKEGRIVARAAAVVDHRYIQHWSEPLGHITMFEAMPDSIESTRALMDSACAWLREHGLGAARCGTGPGPDFGFVIDEYDSLPPVLVRQNPPYYHALLKEAQFSTEKCWVDYSVEIGDELLDRWRDMVAAVRRTKFRISTLGEVLDDGGLLDFTNTWNDAFRSHWGMTPTPLAEFEEIAALAGPIGMYDVSLLAYRGDTPVGAVWASPELTRLAARDRGRTLAPSERLNFLGIGVRVEARGTGLSMAMVARTYLELHRRGATHVGYTMVLEDNWASRRTAEKLGLKVRANYLVYRRELAERAFRAP